MDILIYLYLAMLAAAAFGFFCGAPRYLNTKRTLLYASMIVLGVACIMIGRAYSFLRLLTGLETVGVFHVGILGTVGAFAFFFSSNYGQIDSLVDGGEPQFRKYRLIAVSGIVITGALYAVILLSPANTAEKVTDGIAAAAIAAASYFHVKHILIPDIDYGVVQSLRGYNVTAMLYGILNMLEMIGIAYRNDILVISACALECAASALLIPIMNKGVQRWSK